jgi:hypothetical protein
VRFDVGGTATSVAADEGAGPAAAPVSSLTSSARACLGSGPRASPSSVETTSTPRGRFVAGASSVSMSFFPRSARAHHRRRTQLYLPVSVAAAAPWRVSRATSCCRGRVGRWRARDRGSRAHRKVRTVWTLIPVPFSTAFCLGGTHPDAVRRQLGLGAVQGRGPPLALAAALGDSGPSTCWPATRTPARRHRVHRRPLPPRSHPPCPGLTLPVACPSFFRRHVKRCTDLGGSQAVHALRCMARAVAMRWRPL